jgi:hypothetical protein
MDIRYRFPSGFPLAKPQIIAYSFSPVVCGSLGSKACSGKPSGSKVVAKPSNHGKQEKITALNSTKWGCSSAGRVPDWQSGGREFDPRQLHQ